MEVERQPVAQMFVASDSVFEKLLLDVARKGGPKIERGLSNRNLKPGDVFAHEPARIFGAKSFGGCRSVIVIEIIRADRQANTAAITVHQIAISSLSLVGILDDRLPHLAIFVSARLLLRKIIGRLGLGGHRTILHLAEKTSAEMFLDIGIEASNAVAW